VDRRSDFEAVSRAIVRLCHSSLPADELRSEVLQHLERLVPADAVWWAAVDPATLLFTSAYRVGLPADSAPYFIDNEFLTDDVNKWTTLARDRVGVRSLGNATAERFAESARYRDVFQPLGLGDELRAVLRIQGTTWGLLCLHRAAGHAYTAVEATWLRRLAPHLATGMRLAVLLESVDDADSSADTGIVMLANDGSLVGASSRGEAWLDELSDSPNGDGAIPIEVRAIAARLRSMEGHAGPEPRVRVRTKAGRWAVIHAASMNGPGDAAIAVIIEPAAPTEVAPVIMLAYGLTSQERTITGLISRGLSTTEVADELRISANTVQDHLKSIFGKTGTGSRAELLATLMRQQYLPRAIAGDRVGPTGFFT